MLLRILRNEGVYDYVKPQMLDRLIEDDEILGFYRSGDPVVLGVDPVRKARHESYSGDERRCAS